jgi:hypothetical protein
MELTQEVFRTRGRAAKPVEAAVLRELDQADMVLLSSERGIKPSAIKRITDRHHNLARTLASGMPESDAAIFCGYTVSRVSILKSDPAFAELLEFYREDAQRPYRDLHVRLSGLATDATVLLQEKLEADMELEVDDRKVPVGQLMELTKMGADRTGFGPQTTALNVNVDLAGRLEAARKRVQMRKLTVIEGGREET